MGRTKLSVVLIVAGVVECLAMTYDEIHDFAEHLQNTSLLSPTLKTPHLTDENSTDLDVDYDDDESVPDHAWEESGKFEGDLILNEYQRRLIIEEVSEGVVYRNGIRHGAKKWPNNEVIYHIEVTHFKEKQLQVIRYGIEELIRSTCIKFRPYIKGDRDAVVIQGKRDGCFSQVGYQGGFQVINLCRRHPVGKGCFRHGSVVHELLHAIGFYHMQSSPDRDDYVKIVWANIAQPASFNFNKYNTSYVTDFGVGYDYDSILHYSRRAFSANGQDTIVPIKGDAEIGQRIALSQKDVLKVTRMYCDVQAHKNPPNNIDTKKGKKKNKPHEEIGYFKAWDVKKGITPEKLSKES